MVVPSFRLWQKVRGSREALTGRGCRAFDLRRLEAEKLQTGWCSLAQRGFYRWMDSSIGAGMNGIVAWLRIDNRTKDPCTSCSTRRLKRTVFAEVVTDLEGQHTETQSGM